MSGERVCARCGQWITGYYVQALGRDWHPGCFRCAACGRPIEGQYAERDGAVYHPNCHKERFGLRCAACGGFIEGQYIEYEGHPYHPDCHKQRFGKRCAVCGEYIEGQYIQTFWGESYCAQHRTQYPECYVCQRPVCHRLTGGGKKYQDGRVVCMLCRREAVDDQEQARKIMRQVQVRMARYDLDTHRVSIPLEMVPLTRLTAKGLSGPMARLQGQTIKQVHTLDGEEYKRTIEAVHVLGGLPPVYLENVLAHELGHVWLFMEHVDDLLEDLEEGLCNLFAYLLHQEQTSPEARYCIHLLEENPDPIYGGGFRRARAIYEQRGLPTLLRGVAQHRRWPRE